MVDRHLQTYDQPTNERVVFERLTSDQLPITWLPTNGRSAAYRDALCLEDDHLSRDGAALSLAGDRVIATRTVTAGDMYPTVASSVLSMYYIK